MRVSAQRSRIMRAIRRRDTVPELAVQLMLLSLGARLSRDVASLPGRPDFASKRHRLAIFVHGCFWHRHSCKQRLPRTRAAWWEAKLRRNVERDLAAIDALRQKWYAVLILWECEFADGRAQDRLENFILFPWHPA